MEGDEEACPNRSLDCPWKEPTTQTKARSDPVYCIKQNVCVYSETNDDPLGK